MNKQAELFLKLNSLQNTDDPTILKATFIILDFEKSWNNQVISKEVALSGAKTLLNKPILCKYHPVTEANTPTDALGSHEEYLGTNRYGEQEIMTDTCPIGVFVTEGYVLTLDENGEQKEVLAADAVLWKSKFSDPCNLLLEWFNRGINILTSCEYFYKNYEFIDGVEYIKEPIFFDGHCLLNSEQRGDHKVVLPAYESSRLLSFNELTEFKRLVAQAINQQKEGETMSLFKKVCELSHDDIRSKLYGEMSTRLSQDEYDRSYIVEVFDTYFIYHEWNEGSKYYQVNYTKTEDGVTADFSSKVEVMEERNWTVANSDTEKKVEELTAELNTVTAQIQSLNAQIEQLQPYKDKYEEEQFEKALNEKKEFYAAKFDAVEALDKYESEEVQQLIKKSLNQNDEGKAATLQLNTILVDLVKPVIKSNNDYREFASSMKDLMPKPTDFDSIYSI